MPFADTLELAVILGEAYATVHRALSGLLADGIAARVNHGTVHLPTSGRWFLTAEGIGEVSDALGFAAPSELVRAYPVSRQWLTLLLRRMDAVASVYRLATALSPGYRSLRSRVEFHRRGRFDGTITLRDGQSFGVVRQGLGLRRRSLHDRLRAIVQYEPSLRARGSSGWRRGCARRAGERDPSPLDGADSGRLRQASHAPRRALAVPHRQGAVAAAACPEARLAAPSGADGALGACVRPEPVGEAGAGPADRPPDAAARAPWALAGRLRGAREPGDAQPRGHLGPD